MTTCPRSELAEAALLHSLDIRGWLVLRPDFCCAAQAVDGSSQLEDPPPDEPRRRDPDGENAGNEGPGGPRPEEASGEEATHHGREDGVPHRSTDPARIRWVHEVPSWVIPAPCHPAIVSQRSRPTTAKKGRYIICRRSGRWSMWRPFLPSDSAGSATHRDHSARPAQGRGLRALRTRFGCGAMSGISWSLAAMPPQITNGEGAHERLARRRPTGDNARHSPSKPTAAPTPLPRRRLTWLVRRLLVPPQVEAGAARPRSRRPHDARQEERGCTGSP
jgi:hypothetical protein